MDIIGGGNITSAVSGSNTTYTAIPREGFSFKYWSYGSGTNKENPLTLPTSTVIYSVTFYYSISSYLRGLVGFEIKDENIFPILQRRSQYSNVTIELDTDINDLTGPIKDLLYADVLMWGATGYSTYGSITDSDGGWSHTEGTSTLNAADKKRFESTAKNIYDSYKDKLNSRPSVRILKL